MTQLGTNTQGEEHPELRVVSDFSHIPAPAEATWVGDWEHFKGNCGHSYWARFFTGLSWTIETSLPEPVEVNLAGFQYSEGFTNMWICLEGALDLDADEAMLLAASLWEAAGELDRIQPGRARTKRIIRNPITSHSTQRQQHRA
jgi:hypothetical protein